jgi:hypothetical protein
VSALVQVPVAGSNTRVMPPLLTQPVPGLVVPGGGVTLAVLVTLPLVAVTVAAMV